MASSVSGVRGGGLSKIIEISSPIPTPSGSPTAREGGRGKTALHNSLSYVSTDTDSPPSVGDSPPIGRPLCSLSTSLPLSVTPPPPTPKPRPSRRRIDRPHKQPIPYNRDTQYTGEIDRDFAGREARMAPPDLRFVGPINYPTEERADYLHRLALNKLQDVKGDFLVDPVVCLLDGKIYGRDKDGEYRRNVASGGKSVRCIIGPDDRTPNSRAAAMIQRAKEVLATGRPWRLALPDVTCDISRTIMRRPIALKGESGLYCFYQLQHWALTPFRDSDRNVSRPRTTPASRRNMPECAIRNYLFEDLLNIWLELEPAYSAAENPVYSPASTYNPGAGSHPDDPRVSIKEPLDDYIDWVHSRTSAYGEHRRVVPREVDGPPWWSPWTWLGWLGLVTLRTDETPYAQYR